MLRTKWFSPPACGITIVISASKKARDTGMRVGKGTITGGGALFAPGGVFEGRIFSKEMLKVVRNPNLSPAIAPMIPLAIRHRHLTQHFGTVRSRPGEICLRDADS